MGFHHNNNKKSTKETTTIVRLVHGHRRVKLTMLGMAVVFTVSCGLSMFASPVSPVYARDYDAEIKALQNQISDYNKRSSELAGQSDTLQKKIAELQTQQSEIQAQIDLSTAQKNQLEQQISQAEAKIKAQAKALSQTLQEQYYSKQTSSLDIIMNSHSVSDYVDRQTRQQSVSDQITETVGKIKQAKADLEKKKTEVEDIIHRQDSQKQDLSKSQTEQQTLLDQTQGQEAKYQELTSSSNSKIAKLRAEQAEENARRAANNGGKYINNGGSCGGGYPSSLCNAGKDTLVDTWGMWNRECVSYAAYKVASTYGWPIFWTKGGNNAKQWPAKARSYGLTVSSTPKVGSVAVLMSGYYGHVAWVESVNGKNITVSQYNFDNRGNYGTMEVNSSYFDSYIYFN